MDMNRMAFTVVVGLLGVFVLFSGLDMAIGGIFTLGWLEPVTYLEIVDQEQFLLADNHNRFLGGVWTGLGIVQFISLTNLEKHRGMLTAVFAVVFVGGLARFTQMNTDVLLSEGVLWAVVVEVVGMPLLYLWLAKIVGDVRAPEGGNLLETS